MRRFAIAFAVLVLVSGCSGNTKPKSTPSPEPSVTTQAATPTATPTGPLDFAHVKTVVGGLRVPWELAFVDARTFFVTERPGRVRLVQNGKLRSKPVASLSVTSRGEDGLLGIALDPNFTQHRFAYVYDTRANGNQVSRFDVGADFTFHNERVLLDGIPSASIHDGGRIAFGPDGKLYVTAGEAGEPRRAADRKSLGGKIMRINSDGSIPSDNPFKGSPVWSYGHRNPQGLAWDTQGRLWESEHGPTSELNLCCHDEINLIRKGGFYGWPYRAGNSPAFSGTPPAKPTPPVVTSGSDTWAPAGVVVDGTSGLLVAALRGMRLMRFAFAGSGLRGPTRALDGYGRMRAARFGPDGCLYLSTSNQDGRGTPRGNDDRVLRICRG